MSNSTRSTIYIGVTNDLQRRVWDHRNKTNRGFIEKYNCDRLIYYEVYPDPRQAIERESQLKKWRREKKDKLINGFNPTWRDLTDELFAQRPARFESLGSLRDCLFCSEKDRQAYFVSSTPLRRQEPTPLRSE